MDDLDKIRNAKHELLCIVDEQMHNGHGFRGIDAMELGEVIDMVKDLSEIEQMCLLMNNSEALINHAKTIWPEASKEERAEISKTFRGFPGFES